MDMTTIVQMELFSHCEIDLDEEIIETRGRFSRFNSTINIVISVKLHSRDSFYW